MTKYINLFYKKNQSIIISSGIKKTKHITFQIILIMICLFAALYGIQYWVVEEIKKQEEKKQIYQTYTENNAQREKEILIMEAQIKNAKTVIENDISFLPYYQSIQHFLEKTGPEGTPSSFLSHMNFSGDKSSDITFFSPDYKSHVNLIRLLESEHSEELFEQVHINGTIYNNPSSSSNQGDTNPGYELNTHVIFTDLTHENF